MRTTVVLFTALAWLAAGAASPAVAAPAADWTFAEPARVGLDATTLEALAARIEGDPAINAHSVLVAKDGKLVFERYFEGPDQDWGEDLGVVRFDAETRHDLRSVSKSLTSALVGIAMGEGKIPGPEADVFELFPAYEQHLAPDKHALKLQHILSMTAGLDWFEPRDYTNQGNDEIRLIRSPDPVAFVLGRSFVAQPGTVFEYNGGLPTLLGKLVENAYGQPGDVVLREKLLKPLGIEDFDFRANDSGLLAYASGIRLRPRDMLKVGQLYLQDGRWEGRQVLPEAWVKASLSPQVENARWAHAYGYQWWIVRLLVDGETWEIPMAVGNGNQRIMIVRPLDLVMVTTAGHYNQVEGVYWGHQMLMDYVIPAAGHDEISWAPMGED